MNNFQEENNGIFSMSEVAKGSDTPRFSAKALPLLPTRNLVLFPFVHLPLSLIRQETLDTAKAVEGTPECIGVICQKDPSIDKPTFSDLSDYGVAARVLKVIEMPDGTHTALLLGLGRFKLEGPSSEPNPQGFNLLAKVRRASDRPPHNDDKEFAIIVDLIKEQASRIIKSSPEIPDELATMFSQTNSDAELVNFVATQMPIPTENKMALLANGSIKSRAQGLLSYLQSTEEKVNLKMAILEKTRHSMSEQQRTAFLQNQLEAVKEELFGDNDEISILEQKIEEANLPEAVAKTVRKEIEKLRRTPQQSPDYSVALNYIDTVLDLPWGVESPLNTDIHQAEEILDNDHYGLDKVKNRILEQIAVMMNNPAGHAPILCLVGPPGVGKTSLGQSIAKALGRNYQRVSLGGLHDEAEIRGHRRTYVGAMPGRIIDAMKKAHTSNPVLLLDEVDKIGADFKGDPASALLEVLDPEQNFHFHDNFLDVDYDLSKVFFIATANTLQTLARPLLDRMEIIDISGYIVEEKVKIARLHLLPKILRQYNLPSEDLDISDEAIEAVVNNYTSESGVRQLEKMLAAIVRKVILKKVSDKPFQATIQPEHLKEFLGVVVYRPERYEGNEFAGVVTGLAWTQVGGEILFIESSLSEGKGDKLSLTGNLGNVMKESAVIALQYVKAHAQALGINSEDFEKYSLHIHVPEGAIPKDGPSAGITMATSIISAFTKKKVRAKLAMTGEITLRGKVLPVGGIKEKILAAKRAGITDIVLSQDNRKDVEDISPIYLQGINFHYVATMMDVVKIAITDEDGII